MIAVTSSARDVCLERWLTDSELRVDWAVLAELTGLGLEVEARSVSTALQRLLILSLCSLSGGFGLECPSPRLYVRLPKKAESLVITFVGFAVSNETCFTGLRFLRTIFFCCLFAVTELPLLVEPCLSNCGFII